VKRSAPTEETEAGAGFLVYCLNVAKRSMYVTIYCIFSFGFIFIFRGNYVRSGFVIFDVDAGPVLNMH